MIRRIALLALILATAGLSETGCIEYGPPGAPKTIPEAVTFLISSNTVSNYTPCGCHSGKWGGMPRRGSIFNTEKQDIGWDVLFVDTGDVIQGVNNESYRLKDDYIMQAYQIMDYDVVNVGLNELKVGYDQLKEYHDEYGIPWVSANTYEAGVWPDLPPGALVPASPNATNAPTNPGTPHDPVQPNVENAEPLFPPYRIIEPPNSPGYKIAFLGVMIQDAGRLNPLRDQFSFQRYDDAIHQNVNRLRNEEKVDFIVLLCDTDSFDNLDTHSLFDGIDLVIGSSARPQRSPNYNINPLNPLYREDLDPRNRPPAPEPASGTAPGGSGNMTTPESAETGESVGEPQPLPNPLIMPKGSGRARLVNRLDISLDPAGRPFDYYFEEIRVDDTWEDDPRMAEVSRGYDTDVHAEELMSRVSRQEAGSAACESCHPGFLEAWADFGHFNAYQTIVDEDALDDRECTRCHADGFVEEPRLLTYDLIPEEYRNVGCEGCHPNGRRHITTQEQVNNTDDPERRAQMLSTDTMLNTEISLATCTPCHTGDWAVGFDYEAAVAEAAERCRNAAR